MLTEEEAKQKWCPMAQVIDDLSGAAASARLKNGTVRCIASGCMAWRWAEPAEETRMFHETGKAPDGDGWHCDLSDEGREKFVVKSRWKRAIPNRKGYCGLAGKPD